MATERFQTVASVGPGLGALAAGHIDGVFRATLRGPQSAVTPGWLRLSTGEPHPFANFAMLKELSPQAAAAAVEPLVRLAVPSAVFAGEPLPANAHAALESAGYARHGGLPAMAVDIARLPAAPLPAGCRFERVSGERWRGPWAEAFAAGYELPAGVGAQFAMAIADDASPGAPVQYFAAIRGGSIVSTSMLFLAGGVAGVYGVATLPVERGKGLGAAVTVGALRAAEALAYGVGILQSSEAGYPVYRRLGFQDVGEVPLYVRMPS